MATEISAEELRLVKKLRNLVTDVVPDGQLQDDHYLVRWLRARDLDLVKAETMLRKSRAWRIRNEMDSLLEWKALQNYVIYAKLGYDSEGCPVYLFPVGMWDMCESMEAGDIVPCFQSLLRILVLMEHDMKVASRQFKKPVTQVVLIFDFDEFPYLKHLNNRTVIQGGIEFCKIFEAHCPESIKTCMVINTGRLFKIGFALIRPFMSGKTVSKLEIFGSQKNSWVKVLLERVSKEILPPYYGGTLAGKDEFCSDSDIWSTGAPLTASCLGMVASSRRISSLILDRELELKQSDSDDVTGEWKREEIPAGSKIDLDFPVSESLTDSSSQILKWTILSEHYNLGFQVTFKAEGQVLLTNLIEHHYIDSHLKPTEGSLICEKAGMYTLTLNNSYSRIRKKTVLFNVYLTETNCSLAGPSSHVSTTLKIPSFRA